MAFVTTEEPFCVANATRMDLHADTSSPFSPPCDASTDKEEHQVDPVEPAYAAKRTPHISSSVLTSVKHIPTSANSLSGKAESESTLSIISANSLFGKAESECTLSMISPPCPVYTDREESTTIQGSVVNAVSPVWSLADYKEAHTAVRLSGLPNARGCRIRIPTTLNISYLDANLVGYGDPEVLEFLKFGWPVSSIRDSENVSIPRNHSSARDHPKHVEDFIKKAVSKSSLLGPLPSNPFDSPANFSPLGTVEKSDTTDRRIILDMSFPVGSSVNDTIEKNQFLGEPFYLRYPGVDDLVKLVKLKGRGCALFKRDLKSAYRQLLRVDPGDITKLGFCWNRNKYFDLTHPQGSRSAAGCCQRTTSSLIFIFNSMHPDNAAVNYLDDLAGAEIWENGRAFQAFDQLGEVLHLAGIQEALPKACGPSTQMIFLGVQFDTVTLTLSVTPARLEEIKLLLSTWLSKVVATKNEFQSIVGKLNFIAACVRQGRTFLARLYAVMKSTPDRGCHKIPSEFCKDLHWWSSFLDSYNGVSMMALEDWSLPDQIFTSDSCMSGCGAWNPDRREYFKHEFDSSITDLTDNINQLELLTILLVCRTWGHHWTGKRIVAKCDNTASVAVLNSGCSLGDDVMMEVVREILFVAAKCEFEIRAIHLPGIHNGISDSLSRWHLDPNAESRFFKLIGSSPAKEVNILDTLPYLQPCW